MIKVGVKLRSTVDRALDVRQRDIDHVRVLLGLAEEGATATTAKFASAMGGGGIATELVLAGVDFELS